MRLSTKVPSSGSYEPLEFPRIGANTAISFEMICELNLKPLCEFPHLSWESFIDVIEMIDKSSLFYIK